MVVGHSHTGPRLNSDLVFDSELVQENHISLQKESGEGTPDRKSQSGEDKKKPKKIIPIAQFTKVLQAQSRQRFGVLRLLGFIVYAGTFLFALLLDGDNWWGFTCKENERCEWHGKLERLEMHKHVVNTLWQNDNMPVEEIRTMDDLDQWISDVWVESLWAEDDILQGSFRSTPVDPIIVKFVRKDEFQCAGTDIFGMDGLGKCRGRISDGAFGPASDPSRWVLQNHSGSFGEQKGHIAVLAWRDRFFERAKPDTLPSGEVVYSVPEADGFAISGARLWNVTSKEQALDFWEAARADKMLSEYTAAVTIYTSFYSRSVDLSAVTRSVFSLSHSGLVEHCTHPWFCWDGGSIAWTRPTKTYSWETASVGKALLEIIFLAMSLLLFVWEIEEFFDLWYKEATWKAYFQYKWNLVDLLVFGLIITIYALKGILIAEASRDPASVESVFAPYYPVGWYGTHSAINGILALLFIPRFFKYLSFSSNLGIVGDTLAGSVQELSFFMVVLSGIVLGYAVAGYYFYGNAIESFNTMGTSIETVFQMALGEIDSGDFIAADVSRGIFHLVFYWSFVLLVVFVLTNMFVAIVMDAYANMRDNLKRYSDERTQRKMYPPPLITIRGWFAPIWKLPWTWKAPPKSQEKLLVLKERLEEEQQKLEDLEERQKAGDTRNETAKSKPVEGKPVTQETTLWNVLWHNNRLKHSPLFPEKMMIRMLIRAQKIIKRRPKLIKHILHYDKDENRYLVKWRHNKGKWTNGNIRDSQPVWLAPKSLKTLNQKNDDVFQIWDTSDVFKLYKLKDMLRTIAKLHHELQKFTTLGGPEWKLRQAVEEFWRASTKRTGKPTKFEPKESQKAIDEWEQDVEVQEMEWTALFDLANATREYRKSNDQVRNVWAELQKRKGKLLKSRTSPKKLTDGTFSKSLKDLHQASNKSLLTDGQLEEAESAGSRAYCDPVVHFAQEFEGYFTFSWEPHSILNKSRLCADAKHSLDRLPDCPEIYQDTYWTKAGCNGTYCINLAKYWADWADELEGENEELEVENGYEDAMKKERDAKRKVMKEARAALHVLDEQEAKQIFEYGMYNAKIDDPEDGRKFKEFPFTFKDGFVMDLFDRYGASDALVPKFAEHDNDVDDDSRDKLAPTLQDELEGVLTGHVKSLSEKLDKQEQALNITGYTQLEYTLLDAIKQLRQLKEHQKAAATGQGSESRELFSGLDFLLKPFQGPNSGEPPAGDSEVAHGQAKQPEQPQQDQTRSDSQPSLTQAPAQETPTPKPGSGWHDFIC